MDELIIPLFGIFMIIAVVLGPIWLTARYKSEEKARVHETLRLAFDKGQPLPPEILETLAQDRPRPTPERDLRAGTIWLAVGLGLAIFGWMVGYEENDAVSPLIGMASIPALVGLALIGLGLIGRNKLG